MLAGAFVSPKFGLSELLVQDELGLVEQFAFLVVRDVASAAPIGTSRSAAVVEASGGAIGASGGAMAGRRGPPNILDPQARRCGLEQTPDVPTTDPLLIWSSPTSPGSPLGRVRQVMSEVW